MCECVAAVLIPLMYRRIFRRLRVIAHNLMVSFGTTEFFAIIIARDDD